nr:patatin-like phospholipase family protein [Rhodocyclus tenuis]
MRKTALVLSGGGARAAYQVGVLQAIAEIQPEPLCNPFPIICGTSAGGVNAGVLAVQADNFSLAVGRLSEVWRNFRPQHVYRADVPGVAANALRWLSGLFFGAFIPSGGLSMLDNRPLQKLLEQHLDFANIRSNIERGALDAIAITCSGYTSGQSCSFFEAGPQVAGWNRLQRVGIKCAISVEHLMASTAIPFIFPAYKVHREYFGDGSIRQIAPVSPALHLGADRVMVIGTASVRAQAPERTRGDGRPTLAQVAGHVMSSIFLDGLSVDIERIEHINRTISLTLRGDPCEAGLPLRRVDVMVLTPSKALEGIAQKHVHRLPFAIRLLMRVFGAMRRSGGNLASYLLFEQVYCRELMQLGYQDAIARREEITAFLEGKMSPVHVALLPHAGANAS